MICSRCGVIMKSGTRYEQREGRKSSKKFDECPKCHEKKFGNQITFFEELKSEQSKVKRN